jgi:hypothetical protein
MVVALGLVGCLDDGKSDKVLPIGDIPKLEVHLLRTTGDGSLIELRFDTDEVDGCVTLPEAATAQIDGHMLSLGERGRSDRSLDDTWLSCWWPTFFTQRPIVAPGAFAVADGTASIEGEIGDRLAPRSVTRVPDGPWTFTAGERVSMRWTPAIDLQTVPRLVLMDAATYHPTPEVAGDVVSFTLPAQQLGGAQLFGYIDRGTEEVPCSGATCVVTNQRASVYVELHVE